MNETAFGVIPWDAGKRLDIVLAGKMALSRTGVQRLIEGGHVSVNGAAVKISSYTLRAGDQVAAKPPEAVPVDIQAEPTDLDILYEDEDVIVVNKPQGMVVHPAAGHGAGTLVNALMAHCGGSLSGINGELRPGIVHRIDKDTSGALVCAKNDFAHNHLAEQLARHDVTRLYRAIVVGGIRNTTGVIDKPIGRDPKERKRFAVTTDGKRAVTHWRVLNRLDGHTLIECKLETGRTHQIRVHMASVKHPVLGDPLYGGGGAKFNLQGQALHARTLGFDHPRTGRRMEFTAPEPLYFTALAAKLQG